MLVPIDPNAVADEAMTVTPSFPLVTISLDANGVGVAAQLAAKEVYDIFAFPILRFRQQT